MENKQKVRIHLRTRQNQAGDETLFNQKFMGELSRISGKHYLRYEEPNENGVAQVMLKISPEEILLTRKQENLRLQLPLKLGEKSPVRYHTAYGALDLMVETKELLIEVEATTNQGVIKAEYDLYSGQELLGQYKLRLHFGQ